MRTGCQQRISECLEVGWFCRTEMADQGIDVVNAKFISNKSGEFSQIKSGNIAFSLFVCRALDKTSKRVRRDREPFSGIRRKIRWRIVVRRPGNQPRGAKGTCDTCDEISTRESRGGDPLTRSRFWHPVASYDSRPLLTIGRKTSHRP
jgi:hypothetical protein